MEKRMFSDGLFLLEQDPRRVSISFANRISRGSHPFGIMAEIVSRIKRPGLALRPAAAIPLEISCLLIPLLRDPYRCDFSE